MVKLRRSAGFTVLETVISVAILGALMGLGARMMTQVNRFFILAQARNDMQKEASSAINMITRELRQAYYNDIRIDSCTSTAPTINAYNGVTLSNVPTCAGNQPYYSRITFSKRDKSGNLEVLQFCQQNNKLYQVTWFPAVYNANQKTLKTIPQIKTLSTNLQYLSFSFPRSDDMSIVSLSMTLQKTIYEGRIKALHMASEKVQVMGYDDNSN